MSAEQTAARLIASGERIAELACLGRDVLSRSYSKAPGKWNGLELIAHLAQADVMYCGRFMKCIAEDEPAIVPFAHDDWVPALKSADFPLEHSIALIRACRAAMAHYVRKLPPETLARKTNHPQVQLTALGIAERLVWHAEHHGDQLDAIRDGREWVKGQ